MAARRNQAKTVDGIGLLRRRFDHAKRVEQLAAFGGNRATARLVARKIHPINNDDAIDANLPEMHGGSEASRPGADDPYIGMDSRGSVVSCALRFNHVR
jgi:hypothetical protein